MAGKCGLVVAPVDDEIMTLGLARDRVVDGGIEQFVAFRRPQGSPEIGRVFLPEAHEERAGAGETHPVAALAEIMGEGGNEAKTSARLRDLHIASRPARLIGDIRERELVHEPGAQY